MRIVITGAGGFVGQGLIRAIAGAHEIVAIDRHLPAMPEIVAISGDMADPAILARAFNSGCDAVIHLATVPGGAAERDPVEAKRVNLDGTMALVEAAAATGSCPRFIFASSIAVFGDELAEKVDDATPLAPFLLYGAHKAMMELWLATQSRRGAIDALSLRLPGIVARPKGPSGMKSAFMSEIFHALKAGDRFISPVSPAATMWLMSRDRIAANLIHALGIETDIRTVTMPAIRTTMRELATEIARQTDADPDLVRYEPDAVLEAGFGKQPPLSTPAADRLGFTHDGNLAALVASALGGTAS